MKAYLNWFKEFSKKYFVDAHVWVLVANHVHLLCTPQREGISSGRTIGGEGRGQDAFFLRA